MKKCCRLNIFFINNSVNIVGIKAFKCTFKYLWLASKLAHFKIGNTEYSNINYYIKTHNRLLKTLVCL